MLPTERKRLDRQVDLVRRLMEDAGWYTLARLAGAVRGSEAGVSARLRDLRKEGWIVERRLVQGQKNLYEYRLVKPPEDPQKNLFSETA